MNQSGLLYTDITPHRGGLTHDTTEKKSDINKSQEAVKDTQVHVWRHFEAKGQRHHEEVQGPDVVDLLE